MKEKTQRQIIRSAFLRLMVSNIMISIVICACGLIDNLFVGRLLGKDSLAAMGFFSPVSVAISLSYVIINGAQVVTGNLVGGEPLMEPHILEYMQILKFYGMYVHLWTNGTLINAENAPQLANYCDMITVSLDSPDPAVNDRSRGVPGATEKAIAGLRLLRQNSESLFLRIHSVISALNVDRLREFADLAAEIGVTEIGGALIAPFGFVPENMRFSEEQIGALSNKLEDLCEYAKTKGVALAGCYTNVSAKIIQNLTHIYNMYPHSVPDDAPKHITCMGLWGQATVRPNGDVSVCCFTYKPVFGNLHDNSFAEIWRSDRAEELRAIAKSGAFIDKPCVGCDTGHPIFTKDLAATNSLESFFTMSINAR